MGVRSMVVAQREPQLAVLSAMKVKVGVRRWLEGLGGQALLGGGAAAERHGGVVLGIHIAQDNAGLLDAGGEVLPSAGHGGRVAGANVDGARRRTCWRWPWREEAVGFSTVPATGEANW